MMPAFAKPRREVQRAHRGSFPNGLKPASSTASSTKGAAVGVVCAGAASMWRRLSRVHRCSSSASYPLPARARKFEVGQLRCTQ